MNQKFSGTRSRDWRIPDSTSPLQNLIKKTSTPQTTVNPVTPPPSQNITNSTKLKDVAKPTSFGKFMVILIMHICRKFLYINLKYRLILYVCSTAVISLITDHFPPPGSFFSDPANMLNKYFVNYSWIITCVILALFIYFTSIVFYCGQQPGMQRHLFRLIVLSGWCFFCSYAFDFIESQYSFCTKKGNLEIINKELCPGRWISFAISKRAFQLVQSIIIITEEAKAFVVWERLAEIFSKKETEIAATEASEGQLKIAKKLHEENSAYVKSSVLALTLLIVMLDIANIGTIVYFNKMPQKILAILFAVLGWLITYKAWFGCKTIWSPGIPGENVLIAS